MEPIFLDNFDLGLIVDYHHKGGIEEYNSHFIELPSSFPHLGVS